MMKLGMPLVLEFLFAKPGNCYQHDKQQLQWEGEQNWLHVGGDGPRTESCFLGNCPHVLGLELSDPSMWYVVSKPAGYSKTG